MADTSKGRKGAKSRSTKSTGSSRSGSRGGRSTSPKPAASRSSAARAPQSGDGADFSGKNVADFRDALAKSVISPLNLLMLTRDRIEETVSEAVTRGRMTADDAQDLVQGLVRLGRRQTNDVLSDLEQLLGRGRGEVEDRAGDARKRGAQVATRARKGVGGAARTARSRAAKGADPLVAQADRARRAAGVGSSFPISGYEELSAQQVLGRLGDLTPADLRRVRSYEKQHANRKTVLGAIDSKLG